MTYGFLAVNDSNQVLISSDTRNLHLVQKIGSPTFIDYTNGGYGGMNILRYRTTCAVTPVPFFTAPGGNYVAVSRVTDIGSGQWDIEIIQSGSSGLYPEVYVFADPRGSTATDTYGMIVYRDDGTAAFDSRKLPLAITGGLNVTHPSNPRPSFPYSLSARYCGSDSSGFFPPTEYNTYSTSLPAKPMFFYPSLAQAEREAQFHDSETNCLGSDKFGICITRTVYDWNSWYWAFYRGGIAADSNEVRAGWITVEYGCHWNYNQDDSLIGIGTGGDSGGGGTWPYSNETLNLSAAAVIIGDASRYD